MKEIDLRISSVIEAAEAAPLSPDTYNPIHLIALSISSLYTPALIQQDNFHVSVSQTSV